MIEEQAEGGQGAEAEQSAEPETREADGVTQDAAAPPKTGAGNPEEARSAGTTKPRRIRKPRAFPASSFMEVLPLVEAIQRFAGGHKIRRLTLFESLGRSPESSSSRQLITNSNQYGLTKGSYNAEYLELAEDGN